MQFILAKFFFFFSVLFGDDQFGISLLREERNEQRKEISIASASVFIEKIVSAESVLMGRNGLRPSYSFFFL